MKRLTSEMGLELESSVGESEVILNASFMHSLATSSPSSSTPGATSTTINKEKKQFNPQFHGIAFFTSLSNALRIVLETKKKHEMMVITRIKKIQERKHNFAADRGLRR